MASLAEFTNQLGSAMAAHLLRRSTFGPTVDQINTFSGLTPAQAVDLLFPANPDLVPVPLPPIDPATGSSWVNPPAYPKAIADVNSEQDTLINYFRAWHSDVMIKSELNVVERITWFYHTHLPVAWTEVNSSEAIYYQNAVFRYYALRSFKELFKKICIDNAMLKYLDGYTNHRNSPNENFAREMLELYSIGKGPQLEEGNYTNYTELDIREATKVLTGWLFDDTFTTLDADHSWPSGKLQSVGNQATAHDFSPKTFSAAFSNQSIQPAELDGGYATLAAARQELSDMIDMIFDEIETARFIVRKLYRFFVYHFISEEVENDIIVPLANTLSANNYEIQAVLKQLFKSQHFYDADDALTSNNNIGGVIKSPVDLCVGLLRFFETVLPDRDTQTTAFYNDFINGILPRFVEQGLNFYEPFEVAGFPAFHQMPGFGRNWVMPTELARRYQVGEVFMKRIGGTEGFSFRMDVFGWVENSGHISDPGDANELVTFFTTHLLAVQINTERYEYFLNTVFLDTLTAASWRNEWGVYKGGGSDTVVRERIEYLVSKLIQTPEFQLL
ncbi:MAG: DUF1800 family protein [Bacteroidota bacterium]|nr:MAG: DUF1800 family protein [Bacteroidota bacterium]